MVTVTTGLIEDWIMMRALLQKQVKMLETGMPISGSNETGSATNATVARLKACIAELNVLLKEHARDSRIITATL